MFQLNQSYSKKDIYRILNVPPQAQRGDWDTGYHKYKNVFYIFANIGVPGRTGHDYNNRWEDGNLIWYSKKRATSNQPIMKKMLGGAATVRFFIRHKSRDSFTYKGVGKVKQTSGSAPVEVTWLFKENGFINPDKAWPQAIKLAKDKLQSGELFFSAKEGRGYKIIGVTRQKITVQREDMPSKTTEILTTQSFCKRILKINGSTGRLPKTSLFKKNVALETTFVELVPELDWDNNEDYIEVQITEAIDDKVDVKINILLRVRRGQNKLRKNLFQLYEGKCCISGFSFKEALHACHLIPHAESGNNRSTNALLMRSDIHDLFDSGLIGIHPTTLKIKIHKSLLNSEYGCFNDRILAARTDKIKPDFNALNKRWILFTTLAKT